MLNPDLFYRAKARPGWMLVERHEEPYTYGGLIIVPNSYRARRRPPFATIRDIGPGIDPGFGFEVGGVIAITAAANIRLTFGRADTQWEDREEVGRRHLYMITPLWALMRIEDYQDHGIEDLGEHRQRFWRPSVLDQQAAEGRAEHGVTK